MENELKEDVRLLGIYLRNEEERTKHGFNIVNGIISNLKKEIESLRKDFNDLRNKLRENKP